MEFQFLHTKIRISYLFAAVLTLFFLYDRDGMFWYVLSVVALHEMGHLLAMWLLRAAPGEIDLCSFGIRISRREAARPHLSAGGAHPPGRPCSEPPRLDTLPVCQRRDVQTLWMAASVYRLVQPTASGKSGRRQSPLPVGTEIFSCPAGMDYQTGLLCGAGTTVYHGTAAGLSKSMEF